MADLFVIETILPDGPYWYCGVQEVRKGEAVIRGAQWSPFWEDRKELSHPQATVITSWLFKNQQGVHMCLVENAKWEDTRKMEVDGYLMRARYLVKKQVILRSGNDTPVRVRDISDGIIYLSYKDGHKAGTIGANSDEYVKVLLAYDQSKEPEIANDNMPI